VARDLGHLGVPELDLEPAIAGADDLLDGAAGQAGLVERRLERAVSGADEVTRRCQ